MAREKGVCTWFGTFFWVFGSLSLVLVSLGVIDYISRIVADVVKTVYLAQSQRWSEPRLLQGWIEYGRRRLDHPAVGRQQPLLLLVVRQVASGFSRKDVAVGESP